MQFSELIHSALTNTVTFTGGVGVAGGLLNRCNRLLRKVTIETAQPSV